MPIITDNPVSSGSGKVTAQGAAGNNGGAITTTSASFGDIGLSATVAAVAGDLLLAAFSGSWALNTLGVSTVSFQVITTTGSHAICVCTLNESVSGNINQVSIQGIYTVVSGDISSGNVAVKAQFASDGVHTLSLSNSGTSVPNLSLVNLKH